jgi:hypothetical protein
MGSRAGNRDTIVYVYVYVNVHVHVYVYGHGHGYVWDQGSATNLESSFM